jgi:hypothetical protein
LFYYLGLLLAPDAGQAGGGLTWYDTSGNAANITLPASGVTWNVPSSNKRASSLNITDTTESSSKDTGCLILEGGLGVEKKATFGSTIGVGNTTPSASGAGISFPANQSASTDANTLDDYEEGTCAGLTVTAATGTITSYTITAYYTKIGRQVTISGYIEITNNGTGGGSLRINNLPFTSNYYASGACREGGTHGQAVSMIMNSGDTVIYMYRYDNTYPAATGSNFPFTFTYITT